VGNLLKTLSCNNSSDGDDDDDDDDDKELGEGLAGEIPRIRAYFRCATCGGAPAGKGAQLKLCGACKEERYCSPQCAKGDWKRHKKFCVKKQ